MQDAAKTAIGLSDRQGFFTQQVLCALRGCVEVVDAFFKIRRKNKTKNTPIIGIVFICNPFLTECAHIPTTQLSLVTLSVHKGRGVAFHMDLQETLL
ncbi:hypothetical protein E9531_05945 [Lampropedia puyangensis]|uniref:Uncharacterized protein n=1 Tax=Lampropedia puyangensis TaxID=1330072 RepID=A0A4V4GRU9_9BURK|nr:hypothetical protein [Lampropedia puyangensis]THU03726.1 hypothetical protein E9531_05945 [Lampropedia puyangensis]